MATEGGSRRSRRGGQKADTTVRQHGFYAHIFTPAEQADLAAALGDPSLADEIALLKVLIRRALAEEPDLKMVRAAVDTLCRALKVQYALRGKAARNLEEALAKALDEIGNELGMSL
ncbi:MAG: hypothetical protein M1136_00905 [Chloroflexi bacterium]|nr:hypothetical protein [Chloroflexota bacterium]